MKRQEHITVTKGGLRWAPIDEPIDPLEIDSAKRALHELLQKLKSQTLRQPLQDAYNRVSKIMTFDKFQALANQQDS
jgi:hypothetical protein